ncbi:MFS transporter, partial [Corynebacterium jeikeium]
MNAQPALNTPLQRWLLLAAVGVGITIITIDNTILYTALPSLVEDLGASSTQQLWIVNIYAIVIAGLLLGTGTLGDKIGHRRMFVAGLVIFGIASFVAAFAPTPGILILGRALLAVGGATMMPSTLSLIRLTFLDPAELNLAIGIWGSLSTVSAALGPIAGGLLLELYWWGSCFLINVPLVIAALIAVPFVAPKDQPQRDKHWDFISSFYAMVTLVSAVMLIKEGSHSPQNWPVIGIAAITLILGGWAFTRRQNKLDQPLITLDIFRFPAFRAGALGAALSMFALAGLQYVITQKLQLADGLSPLRSGVYVTFAAIGGLRP